MQKGVAYWPDPYYTATVAPKSELLMFRRRGPGCMTHLGTLWIPAGPGGTLFFYRLWRDGLLVDPIFRSVGYGGHSGVSLPMMFGPPWRFRKELKIVAYNNDMVPHTAEVLCQGYYLTARTGKR